MTDSHEVPTYRQDITTLYKQYDSGHQGLTSNQATERLGRQGRNELEVANQTPLVVTYLQQYKDLMIILLISSGFISYYLGDHRTGIVLWLLAFFNTAIGFLQEYKAGKVMESLERLVVNTASVLRDGKLSEIPSQEIVVGDVVYIEEGNSVPADMRIFSEEELSTNDFALTGESNPSRKFTHTIEADVPLGDRGNIVFMGTTVATGHGYGLVVAVGMHTELGRIANLSQELSAETSPLQKEMNNVATRVTQGTMILCVILLPIAIQAGLAFKDAFLFAIGIASSLIPQGLPAEINTALARAASKLARAKALVKKLSAVESLGATGTILTDKTGTLTKNQMTVEEFLIGSQAYTVDGKGYEPAGTIRIDKQALSKEQSKALDLFFITGSMASNAHISPADDQHPTWYCIGDPTEGAVITLAMKAGIKPAELDKSYPELKEFAFDSARKRMSSIRAFGQHKELYLFAKGAPESILEKATDIWDHGHTRPITAADRKQIVAHNEKQASGAMRNLALAYRVLPKNTELATLTLESAEEQLVWLGMVSMIDPLRPEVPDAMEAAHKAHIKVSIVTGDNAVTAKAIALRAKLSSSSEAITVVSGEELQALSDGDVLALTERGSIIFSRVAPEDKLRIVKLVQESGHVVAVTGDGINDAPALKRADIGVAMGLTGTDVAKQSAEIVLLDDSFSTLVKTVQEGRVIFQNIRKGTLSAFTSNAAELVVNLLSLAAATVFHIPLAISVMQILAIDLVAELFPIAALGGDKADSEVMSEKPRNPKDHILNGRAIIDLLWCGLLMGGFAFANYILFYERTTDSASGVAVDSTLHLKATALTYVTIVLCQLINILQRRSQHGLFTRYQFHNKSLWFAMGFSMFCVVNIVYNPWVAKYFHSAPLSIIDWLYAAGAALLFLAIREFQLWSNRHHTAEAVVALQAQK
jgi:P-type Ca2+ transporter type 2C